MSPGFIGPPDSGSDERNMSLEIDRPHHSRIRARLAVAGIMRSKSVLTAL
jgi:hypothetical protein